MNVRDMQDPERRGTGGQHRDADPAHGEGVSLDQGRVGQPPCAHGGQARGGVQRCSCQTHWAPSLQNSGSCQNSSAENHASCSDEAVEYPYDRTRHLTAKATLRADLHTSMRAHDTGAHGDIEGYLFCFVTNEEVSGATARELSDDEVLKVIAKEAKKRREAATAYIEAKRPELAAKEEAELVFLEAYLPAQLSDPELEALWSRRPSPRRAPAVCRRWGWP